MTAHLRHLLASTHLDADGRAVVYADRLDAAIVATEAEEERLLADLAVARGRSVAQARYDALGRCGSGDYAQEGGSSSERGRNGAESGTSALSVHCQETNETARSDR